MKNTVKNTLCAIVGPAAGLLPSSVQENIAGEDGARIMSTTSRIINGTLALGTVATGIGRLMGLDIDPLYNNILTSTPALILAADTVLREAIYAGICALGNDNSYTKPWEEPITSMIYENMRRENEKLAHPEYE